MNAVISQTVGRPRKYHESGFAGSASSHDLWRVSLARGIVTERPRRHWRLGPPHSRGLERVPYGTRPALNLHTQ
jgi:hypothetical protein